MLNNAFELENAFRNNLDMPMGKKSRMVTSKNEFMSNDKSQYRLAGERRDSTSSASFSNETTTNTSPCSSSTNVRCHSDEKPKRNHQHSTDRLVVMKKKINRNYDNKVNKKKSRKSSHLSKNFQMISNELYKTGQYFNSQSNKKGGNKENNLFGLSWSSRRSLNHNNRNNNNNGKDIESKIMTSNISTSHCPLNTEADKLYCHPMKKLNSYCDNDTRAIIHSSSGSDQDSNSKGTSTTSEHNELDMEQYKKIKFSKSGNFKRSIVGIFVLIILTSFIILSALFFLGRNHFNSTFFHSFHNNSPDVNLTNKNYYSKYVRNHTIEVNEQPKIEEKENLIHLVNQILFGYSNDSWTIAPILKNFSDKTVISTSPTTRNDKQFKEILSTTTARAKDELSKNYDSSGNEDKMFEINSVQYFVVNTTEDKVVSVRKTTTSTSTKSTTVDNVQLRNDLESTPTETISTKIDEIVKQTKQTTDNPIVKHNSTLFWKKQKTTDLPSKNSRITISTIEYQTSKPQNTSFNININLPSTTSTTSSTTITTTIKNTEISTSSSPISTNSTTSTTSLMLKKIDINKIKDQTSILNKIHSSTSTILPNVQEESETDEPSTTITTTMGKSTKNNNSSSDDAHINLVVTPNIEVNASSILDHDSTLIGNFNESSSDYLNMNVTQYFLDNIETENLATNEITSTTTQTENRVKRKNSNLAVSIFQNLFNLNDTSIF
ncbi:hypothetical protein SNEBB_006352 [Seison nebaliae]|nr:hypothetical protein SNEBB_006352 [Seison nebaliae]